MAAAEKLLDITQSVLYGTIITETERSLAKPTTTQAAVWDAEAESQGGSQDRILDAAERLVAERGYTAASISLISKASGLPASSIYWHFGSKEGLLAAVVERA